MGCRHVHSVTVHEIMILIPSCHAMCFVAFSVIVQQGFNR